MTILPPDLPDRWAAVIAAISPAGSAGSAGAADPAPYAQALLTRWAEPHRAYHTPTHLAAVLTHLDTLADHPADPDLVRLAAWFHDAVYDPERDTNEERSARLAERALAELGVGDEDVAEVARLVRLTVTHDPDDGDTNGEALCDADLAVLASAPEDYAAYASAVRTEYAFVPDPDFRTGRAAVLAQLLAMPRLFRTPYGTSHWEDAARHNLTTELLLLSP
ncbi:HD domain-containing protein [Streptomyces sp. NBC_00237]|uniref:HD domain-containing protein n=1 Tax=Streptomyces sp. NBC_00237 TaxID=2975687 RepID=UPI002254F934|nr:HD domain-containing protein [Streptomyces sp. NBC_00237]MCX5200454.1 HD domain-containing protein [Streptomyces sp. NBC_00237]